MPSVQDGRTWPYGRTLAYSSTADVLPGGRTHPTRRRCQSTAVHGQDGYYRVQDGCTRSGRLLQGPGTGNNVRSSSRSEARDIGTLEA